MDDRVDEPEDGDEPGEPPAPPNDPPRLSRIDALTNTPNAAIGTYSSTIPLYYADMQSLVERLGELRLGIQAHRLQCR